MYSWSKDWPTLTELFFGKGNGPQGALNGMTKEAPKKKATFDERFTTSKKKSVKSKDK